MQIKPLEEVVEAIFPTGTALKSSQIRSIFSIALTNKNLPVKIGPIDILFQGEVAFTITPHFQIEDTLIWITNEEGFPDNKNYELKSLAEFLPENELVLINISRDGFAISPINAEIIYS